MTVNLLDLNYYRQVNPELANFTDEQATEHFFNFGLREGRDFSPIVDLDLYKEANPDLTDAGFTENRQFFDHLANFGVAEGRLFSHTFQADFYRASHDDLVAAGFDNEQLFEHFEEFGIDEGRVASNLFDIDFYLNSHPDLVAAGLNNRQGLTHFNQFGIHEGRTSSPQFDVGTYLSLNADLTQAGLTNAEAFEHYQLLGINERRIAAPLLPHRDRTDNFDFGIVSGNRRFSGTTGDTNQFTGDIHQFSLFRPSAVSANLSPTNNPDLDISLLLFADLNGNGRLDFDEPTIRDSGSSPDISGVLPAGNYGLSVPVNVHRLPIGAAVGVSAIYTGFEYEGNLLVSPVESLPADNAGHSIATARDLGTLTTTQTFNDSLVFLDNTDIYRFTLDAPTNIEALVDGTSTEVQIEIAQDFNNNGEIEGFESYPSNTEIIETSTSTSGIGVLLDAGTYFLRLRNPRFQSGNSTDTDYTLTLSPQASQFFPDGAGNILPAALDVGVLDEPRSFADTVGVSDSNDYYQFEIETPTNVGVTLDVLTRSASLVIGRDFDSGSSESIISEGRDSLQSQLGITAADQTAWSLHLTPGTYFARVSNGFSDSASAVYDLDITPTPPPGLPADAAGNKTQTARNLDVLTGMETFSDSVGSADRSDVYRFVVDRTSTVDFLLEASQIVPGFSALRVFNDLNNDGFSFDPGEFSQSISFDPATLNAQESIELEPGVYFVQVSNFGTDNDNVNYDLSLSVI